eukprot:CAMPEP_0117003136 /NCGR_PEP_ID=MMETSP0472-20121206/4549_1 /TAXON_ID=693140 ORGANISM="Tiarina fusus, Strain LIS" /NCGR_SAMPLE_ID=MMETSP0472 /ASSEMBLY_ACC=CAM_ASM_000603 /LENGTH=162 /DNA_ID=CAMNT_0004703669 /DNA_START=44 /DNA_END=532 /DNA_ORIENTATION=+
MYKLQRLATLNKLQRLATLASRVPRQRFALQRMAAFSENITYSGGQATEGQGGYYGSGGARALGEVSSSEDIREGVLAMAGDVQKIISVIKEVEVLEGLLERETDNASGRSIELKANIKKLMTNSEVTKSLDRLEVQGEPVWGLSSEERELVVLAREKVNGC